MPNSLDLSQYQMEELEAEPYFKKLKTSGRALWTTAAEKIIRTFFRDGEVTLNTKEPKSVASMNLLNQRLEALVWGSVSENPKLREFKKYLGVVFEETEYHSIYCECLHILCRLLNEVSDTERIYMLELYVRLMMAI